MSWWSAGRRRSRRDNCVTDCGQWVLILNITSVGGQDKHTIACSSTIRANMNTVTLVQSTQLRSDNVCASTTFRDYPALLPPRLVGALELYTNANTQRLQRFGTFAIILLNDDLTLAAFVQIYVVARLG